MRTKEFKETKPVTTIAMLLIVVFVTLFIYDKVTPIEINPQNEYVLEEMAEKEYVLYMKKEEKND